jgi:hypothetical protein
MKWLVFFCHKNLTLEITGKRLGEQARGQTVAGFQLAGQRLAQSFI